jgi:DNA (cytosine-5)-methyltransferase 1
MRIIELFAGIGACSVALKRIGIDLEIVDAVEIDKYAIASFNAIHGTNFETQDITTYKKTFENIDLITHGSPCQDFSVAGKQAGGDIGSGTRSSLMYETIRIVGQIRPKYVLWENVKNILSKKHKHNFDSYIETMNVLGYNSYYQVLNAKDYGIPQNRERVYTVSIRKDIDKGGFKFPEKEELKLRLKDMLEDEVDEKYYLSKTGVEYFKEQAKKRNDNLEQYDTEKLIKVAHGYNQGSVSELSICPTLDMNFSQFWRGTILEPKILIKNATKKGYDQAKDGDSINLSYPESTTRRGRVGHQVSQTLQCNDSMGVTDGFRIRKLTPEECWRLMGFSDEDFEKAQNVPTSNTQLYKQAGNSIVVNVLEKIFENLFEGERK